MSFELTSFGLAWLGYWLVLAFGFVWLGFDGFACLGLALVVVWLLARLLTVGLWLGM